MGSLFMQYNINMDEVQVLMTKWNSKYYIRRKFTVWKIEDVYNMVIWAMGEKRIVKTMPIHYAIEEQQKKLVEISK